MKKILFFHSYSYMLLKRWYYLYVALQKRPIFRLFSRLFFSRAAPDMFCFAVNAFNIHPSAPYSTMVTPPVLLQRVRPGDAVELPPDDAVLEDGRLSGCRQHGGHQAGPGVPADGAQVRRARRQGRVPAGRHQCGARLRSVTSLGPAGSGWFCSGRARWGQQSGTCLQPESFTWGVSEL